MFLGWYDPDKRRKAIDKLDAAVERYEEKFGVRPRVVVVGPTFAEALASARETERPQEGGLEVRGMPVRVAHYVPLHTLYVGEEDFTP